MLGKQDRRSKFSDGVLGAQLVDAKRVAEFWRGEERMWLRGEIGRRCKIIIVVLEGLLRWWKESRRTGLREQKSGGDGCSCFAWFALASLPPEIAAADSVEPPRPYLLMNIFIIFLIFKFLSFLLSFFKNNLSHFSSVLSM